MLLKLLSSQSNAKSEDSVVFPAPYTPNTPTINGPIKYVLLKASLWLFTLQIFLRNKYILKVREYIIPVRFENIIKRDIVLRCIHL